METSLSDAAGERNGPPAPGLHLDIGERPA